MNKIRPRAVDMRSLKLSAEEGFVLSRIDAPLSFSDLVAVCGLDEERVTAIVQRLVAEGAVELGLDGHLGAAPPASASGPTSAVQYASRTPAPAFEGIDELGDLSGEVEPSGVVIHVCGVTDVGVVRTNNEDAFSVMDLTSGEVIDVTAPREALEVGPRGLLLAVSDGMGGQNAGEVASAITLETIVEQLTSSSSSDAAGRLAAAVEEANVRVVSAADEPGRSGMGATLVALLLEGTSAYTAEVGDSRVYVLRRGVLTQITKDQTQIQILLDQGLLTPETAKSSRAKNIVLQAIGKTPELTVAQRHLHLHHGDRLLLCSDGLTAHLADAEIAQVLGSASSLATICTQLVTMTNQRGGKDNTTVVIAEVAGSAPADDAASVDQTMTTLRAFSVGEP